MKIRLLKGQVVIREDHQADYRQYKHIIVPTNSDPKRRTWHRGKVIAMGAPPETKNGTPVRLGFYVGDDVIFHWEHLEKAWTRPWIDGKDACWVPWNLVDAVIVNEHGYAENVDGDWKRGT